MIQIIFGKKGSGKTKRILDMANASVNEAKGNVLFVDDDRRYTLSLKPQVRFIDASEYAVKGVEPFYGFLAGILAGNYDISVVYIDAFLKLVNATEEQLIAFFAKLERLVESANCDIVISYSEDTARRAGPAPGRVRRQCGRAPPRSGEAGASEPPA